MSFRALGRQETQDLKKPVKSGTKQWPCEYSWVMRTFFFFFFSLPSAVGSAVPFASAMGSSLTACEARRVVSSKVSKTRCNYILDASHGAPCPHSGECCRCPKAGHAKVIISHISTARLHCTTRTWRRKHRRTSRCKSNIYRLCLSVGGCSVAVGCRWRGPDVWQSAQVLLRRVGVRAAMLVQLALRDQLLLALRHRPQAPPAACNTADLSVLQLCPYAAAPRQERCRKAPRHMSARPDREQLAHHTPRQTKLAAEARTVATTTFKVSGRIKADETTRGICRLLNFAIGRQTRRCRRQRPPARVGVALHDDALDLGDAAVVASAHYRRVHLRDADGNRLALRRHHHHLPPARRHRARSQKGDWKRTEPKLKDHGL